MPRNSNPLDRFDLASDAPKNRIISANWGFPGCGKNYFAFGAPGPIVLLDFNRGYEGVVEQFQFQKDIRIKSYNWLPGGDDAESQDLAVEIRTEFEADYEVALEHARTVIIDLESELWEVYRYAEFGAPSDNPKDFAQLNQRYRKLINMAKATNINLIMLQGMKEAWVKKVNTKTGAQGATSSDKYERWGFKELEGLVHVNIEHRRVKVAGESSRFEIEVGKSRGPGSMSVQDQTFVVDESFGFKDFAQLVFPDSEEGDWE